MLQLKPRDTWILRFHDSEFDYFAADQINGAHALLKVLRQSHPTWDESAILRRELEQNKDLLPTLSLQPMGFLHQDNHAVLVWPERNQEPLFHRIPGYGMEVEPFLDLAISLVESLGMLHHSGWAHYQLNPAAIWWIGDRVYFADVNRLGPLTTQAPTQWALRYLPYQAPEQSGRTGQGPDYRADFYALGCIFFQMLTGQTPFGSGEPNALIHCHLARTPPLVHERVAHIPISLSQVVLTLMDKNPNNRYQSAYGLAKDLKKARDLWQEQANLSLFFPQHHQISHRFHLTEKLYGREETQRMVDESLVRIRLGGTEVLWFKGPPGVGKSALSQELIRRKKHEWVLSGSSDGRSQVRPYQPILEAIEVFIQQVLTRPEGELQSWKTAIARALGANAAVLVEAVPKLGLIVEKPSKVPSLTAPQAKNRFFLVLQSFIQCLAQTEHPLVLLLDDLDQADPASHEFIEWLLRQPGNHHVLVVITSQDFDENPNLQFNQWMERLDRSGIAIHIAELRHLKSEHICALLTDSLDLPPTKAQDLAQAVMDKTFGNPFFVHQFLADMYREHHLWIDPAEGWCWNPLALKSTDVTENVVDFVLAKLKKQSPERQKVLVAAACLGQEFRPDILHALPMVKDHLEHHLVALEKEGLIIRENAEGTAEPVLYKFAHGRIRQSALTLADRNTIAHMHFELAQVYQVIWKDDTSILYALLFHLKAGMSYVPSGFDHAEGCRLNLRAARKARAEGAYLAAHEYLDDAFGFFDETWWLSDFDFAYELTLTAAECAYLSGAFEAADRYFAQLFERIHTDLERARVMSLQVLLHTHLDRADQAAEIGLKALRLLGVNIPRNPKKWRLIVLLLKIRAYLLVRGSRLTNMPAMTDERFGLALELCSHLQPAAYILNSDLYGLITFKMVELTLRKGIRSVSSVAFINFSVVLGSALGNYPLAQKYASFALKWVTQFHDPYSKGRCELIFAAVIHHWMASARDSPDRITEARAICQEAGDLLGVNFSNHFEMMMRWILGNPLDNVLARAEQLIQWTKTLQYTHFGVDAVQQLARNLKGQTLSFGLFDSEQFDEAEWLKAAQRAENVVESTSYRILRIQAHYYAGNYSLALQEAKLAKPTLYSLLGQMILPQYHFYTCLSLCAHSEADSSGRHIRKHIRKMRKWAKFCPENFEHLQHIMRAEYCVVQKKWNEAIAHFDSAISAANRNGFVQDNALAHERLGLCHGAMGKELVAKAYLEEAMRLYRVWGAEGKCQHLLQTCPYFKRETSTDRRHLTGTHSLKPEAIDLETVLKGTQTLSAQIKEDQLIASIMEIALENAGAQMGALLLVKNELMSLVALAREGRIETMPQDTLPYGTLLANTPLHFVMRTREPLVLNDASNDTRFNQDPYIKTHQIRTLICIPLLHKGQLLGLLYMENNVLSQNFTTQRLGILEWLGTQAAIALENARLYGDLSRYSQDLEQKVAERTLVIQEKNQQILASIRYAKRIQNAVLPQPDLLNEICAEHFLLFRPRDLVSGDFFWLKNGKSPLIAVADCTGHGVPGAFMSLVGSSLLNQIVGQEPDLDPASILMQLDRLIRSTLKSVEGWGQPTDGMDIALCRWHEDSRTLIFAGAKRPLYWANPNRTQVLEEIKGDNRTIGGFGFASETHYNNIELRLEPGDMVYLTSDGFADQQNEQNKKLGSRTLRTLLGQICGWDVQSQREALINELERHQAGENQRDDITVLGLKFLN